MNFEKMPALILSSSYSVNNVNNPYFASIEPCPGRSELITVPTGGPGIHAFTKFVGHSKYEHQKVDNNSCTTTTSSSLHAKPSSALLSFLCHLNISILTRSLSQSLSRKVIVETSIPFILEFFT